MLCCSYRGMSNIILYRTAKPSLVSCFRISIHNILILLPVKQNPLSNPFLVIQADATDNKLQIFFFCLMCGFLPIYRIHPLPLFPNYSAWIHFFSLPSFSCVLNRLICINCFLNKRSYYILFVGISRIHKLFKLP